MKTQSTINNSENSNIFNNVENLFSSKVKFLESELKEMKDIYKQNLEKLNKKQNENKDEKIQENQSSQNKI